MKVSLLLFLLFGLLTICYCENVENVTDENTSVSKNTYEKRKLPIFPKSGIKFIVKPNDKENIKEDENYTKYATRKPLMMKMIPKSKTYSVKTTEPVTRKPFMKIKTYTVKMRTKEHKYEDVTHRDVTRKNPDKSYDRTSKSSTNIILNEKTNQVDLSKKKYEIMVPDILPSPIGDSNKKDFFKEEEQDRNEFIFLEKKNENIEVNDLLYVEEEFETTTEKQILERHKRSSNIIEEENMGTTFSAIKYTGRDGRLTNDLYYKNIHH